jgi:hypothetical protein
MIRINVSDQEFHTIVAALRFYQEKWQGDPGNRSDWIHDLATNGDNTVSLDTIGIDDLTEQINTTAQTVPDSDARAENLIGQDPAFPCAAWERRKQAGQTDLTYWAWVQAQASLASAKPRNVEVMVCEAYDGDNGNWYTEYLEIPAGTPDDHLDLVVEEIYRQNMKPDDKRNIVRVMIYCANDPFECEDE